MIIISASRKNLDYASQAPLHPGYTGCGPNDDHGRSLCQSASSSYNTIGRTLMYRLLIIALSLVLLSCASQTPVPESKTIAENIPGVTPLLNGTETWKEYNCDSKKLPFIVVEQDELRPTNSVKAGTTIQHRFVYAACTSSSDQRAIIKGSLSREISYKGGRGSKVVVPLTTTPNFDIEPGKWVVNAIVQVPPKAKPGNYDFELTISSPMTTVKKNLPFMVYK